MANWLLRFNLVSIHWTCKNYVLLIVITTYLLFGLALLLLSKGHPIWSICIAMYCVLYTYAAYRNYPLIKDFVAVC